LKTFEKIKIVKDGAIMSLEGEKIKERLYSLYTRLNISFHFEEIYCNQKKTWICFLSKSEYDIAKINYSQFPLFKNGDGYTRGVVLESSFLPLIMNSIILNGINFKNNSTIYLADPSEPSKSLEYGDLIICYSCELIDESSLFNKVKGELWKYSVNEDGDNKIVPLGLIYLSRDENFKTCEVFKFIKQISY